MRNRVFHRYSQAFKRQVVQEIEAGRFCSIQAAGVHHGIKGATTVRDWVRRLGKNHLLAKVVRVEAIGEADQILALRRQVERLEKALGQTQAERLLNAEYLFLACEQMGEEVESFKKKSDGKRCTDAVGREG
jgi:transposase-like protein